MDFLIDDTDREPELPPGGHPLRKLGARLTELLDDDHWAECERLLLEGWKHDEIDRKIGKHWREDSGLEIWFPLTAEELERLRAEVERLRASQQWQPIETAPMDGSSVIIGISGKGSGEGVYATEPGWKGWPKPGWYWVGEDADLARPIEPTHWMPLREPPSVRLVVDEGDEG